MNHNNLLLTSIPWVEVRVADTITVGTHLFVMPTLATFMGVMYTYSKENKFVKTSGRCITQLANMSIDP